MQKKLNNLEAAKLMKKLESLPDKNEITSVAFSIYNQIHVAKDNYSINALLNICCNANKPETLITVWPDIIYTNSVKNISHPLILKCCSNALKQKQITKEEIRKYVQILQCLQKYNNDVSLSTALINSYSLLNETQKALKIFNSIPSKQKNIICIGCMMKCYLHNNENDNALLLHQQYHSLNNDITQLFAIKSCTNSNNFDYGNKIINKYKHKTHSIHLLCTYIDFYNKYKDIDTALQIFHSVPDTKKNTVFVNCIINSLVKNNNNEHALLLYRKYKPLHTYDDISHVLALKACININDYDYGKQIIEQLQNKHSIQLNSTLIHFYSKSDDIDNALNVFMSIPKYNVNAMCLNAMIKAYLINNEHNMALSLYQQYEPLHDEISHILSLKACVAINSFEYGQNIIQQHINYTQQTYGIQLCSYLLEFYGKFNHVQHCWDIFNSVSDADKDGFFIGVMMKYCLQNNDNENVISLYKKYHKSHCNHTLQLLSIKACIKINCYQYGKQIIEQNVGQNHTIELLNTYIQFYAKMGDIN